MVGKRIAFGSMVLLLSSVMPAFPQGCVPCGTASERLKKLATSAVQVELVENNVFVPVTLTNGGRCTDVYFILDTGTNRTIIEKETAEALQYPVASTGNLVAPGGLQRADNVRIDCLRIGDQEFTGVVATLQDMSLYTHAYKRHVAGLIGTDLLKDALTRIDHINKTLVLHAAQPLPDKPLASIPIRSLQGLPLIECELPAAIEAELIVDTGCDCELTVYDDVASKLTIREKRIVQRSDASGTVDQQTIGMIDSIVCGDLTLKPISVIVGVSKDKTRYNALARPGMLGNLILSRYVVELDLRQNRLRLYALPTAVSH